MDAVENATDALVDHLLSLVESGIPERVVQKARECLLDYIGVTFAGAVSNRGKMAPIISVSSGPCSLIGLDEKAPGLEAAFINAFNAHSLELDDGSRFGMIHLGAPIISAVAAFVQDHGLSYEQLLRGIVLGYEAAVKTSRAMQPGHKKRGFHTSGTCGTIGAAMGCACALGCSKSQLRTVLASAATSAAGLLEIQEGESTLKPYNVAHAAMAGLAAANLGLCDFAGPEDILGGSRGMLRLLSDSCDFDKLCEKGEHYEIERIYVKPYAACRHNHSAIEAALRLRDNPGIPFDEIDGIVVRTYELAVRGHDHTEVNGIASAKLSMPFGVAAAYILGSAGLEAFTEKTISNRQILDLAHRVTVTADEGLTRESSAKRAAIVRICTASGEFECQVDYAKGDPENPMSFDELVEKFRSLMEWSGMSRASDEVISRIFS